MDTTFDRQTCQRAMRYAIFSACFGAVSQILVQESSVVILYATKLGASRFVSLCTTSLQLLSLCVLIVPLAYWMSFAGKKRLVLPALAVSMVGLLLASCAHWFGSAARIVLLVGLSVFSISVSVYVTGWFPLLRDIVPQDERGRFFGRMRISWQLVTAVYLAIAALVVRFNSSMLTMQLIIVVAALGIIGRIILLSKIPERQVVVKPPGFWFSVTQVLRNTQLIGFGTYLFWLYASAGAIIPIMIVMAKIHLNLADDFILVLSSCNMLGAIAGFFIGGKMVDSRGSKPVFLISHFSFGLLSFAMLMIYEKTPFAMGLLLAIATLYGVVYAAATIAVSSEAFALVPENHTEVGLAMCLGLYYAGIGLSRFLTGWVLDCGMLAEYWKFGPFEMSQYHSLFLIFGAGVIATCVLLVMVPSIVAGKRMAPHV